MAELAGWRPLQDAHAIQMAAVSASFASPLPDLAWKRVGSQSKGNAEKAGLKNVQALQSLTFATGANALPAFQPAQGVAYLRMERPDFYSEKLQLLSDSVRYENWAYTRWAAMNDRLRELISPAVKTFSDLSSLTAISSEYVDVFEAIADGVDVDCSAIIKSDSPGVARMAFSSDKPWHTHCGWFQYPSRTIRRLFVLQIDVADKVVGTSWRRVIQISTQVTDQFNQAGLEPLPQEALDWTFFEARLQEAHVELKHLLRSVITAEAADLIAMGGA